MTRTVTAIQSDTMDSLIYRHYGNQSSQYLPAVLELNPELHGEILSNGQVVKLPEGIITAKAESLSLWD